MTDCIFHPENLVPGNWYEITFKSAIADDAGITFTVMANFKRLEIGESETDNETGRRLKVAIRVGKEPALRRISWSRITLIIPHETK